VANLLNATQGFLEISLDGTTDFDSETDLVLGGLSRNAPNGLRIKTIRFDPSADGDEVIVRDGQNGPAIFRAVVIGRYDNLIEPYRDPGNMEIGKLMNPYIDEAETIIANPNQASIVFEF